MPTWNVVDFLLTGLDIAVLLLVLINFILLFVGMGRFAIYNAIDAFLYLFFPRFSLKVNYKKYFPRFTKDLEGNIAKTFQTSRDECAPDFGPLHERVGDFILRTPFFSVLIFLVFKPLVTFYFNTVGRFIASYYPLFSTVDWSSAYGVIGRLFIVFFFLPFSSLHAIQISTYALIVFPVLAVFRGVVLLYRLLVWIIVKILPFFFFLAIFLLLFCSEILINYVGFLPMFHKGILPFIDAAEGLKQFIFWSPIKFKIYLDLILLPLVIVIPFITSVGSYILAKADAKKNNEDVNFLVLFYKTGIAYFYEPILGSIFPNLRVESRIVRSERKINEILVICMYLESFVCVAGMGYAYYTVAAANGLPLSGIGIGLVVLLLFVPLIVFSTNGFQSHFLDTATRYWDRIFNRQ
ncbi:MAG: hypothetical protein ACYC5N_06055 [Endomicrobiales bacterium]